MPVPIVYRKSGEAVTLNFDWIDVAEGTGYVGFYGAAIYSGANGFMMTTNSGLSSNIAYTAIAAGSTGLKFDQNFDLSFNMPQVIKGDIISVIPIGSGSSNDKEVVATIQIKKVDTEGTVSNITAVCTGAHVTEAGGTYIQPVSQMHAIKSTMPQTKFKKGETLRAQVRVETIKDASYTVGHDPGGRSVVAATNLTDPRMRFFVPFQIDK